MVFNSYLFILAFLPIALLTYHLAARQSMTFGRGVLIALSAVFYALSGWKTFLFLLTDVIINLGFAQAIQRADGKRRTILLTIAVVLNVASLGLLKYADFAIGNINALFGTDLAELRLFVPLGLSFFTFSQIAYLVSLSRNQLADKSILGQVLFIVYFPKLLMGPIADPAKFESEVRVYVGLNSQHLASGIRLFAIGLVKKVILADCLADAVNYGFGHIAALTSADLILVMLAYTFQLYFDFSGYTDMALGVSRMFGIELPINFDSPYKALSIRDFWKRWHLSLTKFLTTYVYFPLGGSKRGVGRTYLNILIVFLVSGIWHGSNWTFIIWGLLHGLLMVRDRLMERFDEKLPRLLRWSLTFVVINFLWALFRANDLSEFIAFVSRLGANTWTVSTELLASIASVEFDVVTSFGLTCSGALCPLLIVSAVICLFFTNATRQTFKPTMFSAVYTAILLFWGIVSLGGEAKFLYFNF